MKLILKTLGIQNFKGVTKTNITFKEITNIEGANRTGKTTIFDALTWLLFGKNAADQQKFGIKRFLKDGSRDQTKSDILIIATFDLDGKELIIKRTLKEIWRKKRGELTPEFVGNETLFEWNDSPLQLKEFESKRNNLIDEKHFKLITNPLYFNSLDTQPKRDLLISLVKPGTLKNLKSEFSKFSQAEFIEFKKSIAGKIKLLKDELKEIPIQITECENNKPEPLNFDMIQANLNAKKRSLEQIEAQIIDKSKVLTDFNNNRLNEQKTLAKSKSDLELFISDFKLKNNIERTELEQKIQENKAEITKCEGDIKNLDDLIETNETSLKFQNSERDKRLREWDSANELKFDLVNCAACGQKLPQEDIDEAKENFLINKNNILDRINKEGQNIAFRIGELTQKIKNLGGEKFEADLYFNNESIKLRNLQKELEQIKEPIIEENKEYMKMKGAYLNLDEAFHALKPPTVNADELKAKKETIKTEIESLIKQLEVKTTIAAAESRVKELEIQEQTKANILVGLENQEFEMEKFNKAKMSLLETEINKRFKFVKFRMFEPQINGGEREVCICLIDGVPFSDANSEAKVNGGLDIINTFSEHYNISAPIFIDNREGVTELIETKAQIINLIVNPEFKTLKIS